MNNLSLPDPRKPLPSKVAHIDPGGSMGFICNPALGDDGGN